MRAAAPFLLALACIVTRAIGPVSAQQAPDPRSVLPLLEQQRNAALNNHAVALALAGEEASALKVALAERDRRLAELERQIAALEQRIAELAGKPAAPAPTDPAADPPGSDQHR